MRKERKAINNKRESAVAARYEKAGYNYLKKGWPDFLFIDELDNVIFVEVKRKQTRPSVKGGLSAAQRKMKEILSKLGEYRVEYVE